MAKCNHCSAPLPANTNVCSYCGSRNDVDLTGRHDYQIIRQQSEKPCPHCQTPLQTIDLNRNGQFLLDRCSHCFGLFFNPGQIETLLDNSVAEVFQINLQRLDNINRDRFQADKPVKYIKCPVCLEFMHRHVFAYRSGVVIDQCKDHGIWLDSGEISHLLEWKKAGGQLLQDRQPTTEAKQRPVNNIAAHDADGYSLDYVLDEGEIGVLDVLTTLLNKFLDR